MAQVPVVSGAGEEKGAGPAPPEGVGARFVAQVPQKKSLLRQKGNIPAPYLGLPVPKRVPTCAKGWAGGQESRPI